MTMQHDGRGNIIKVQDFNPQGDVFSQTYKVDRMNRVTRIEFDDSNGLDVRYDGLGRPSGFDTEDHSVNVEYLGDGKPVRLRSGMATLSLDSGNGNVMDQPIQSRPRSFLHNDNRAHGQPDYGWVSVDQHSLDVRLIPVEINSVSVYLDAELKLLSLKSWLDQENRGKIEKPSNPIFQPPEYVSTNCCASCLWNAQCGQICAKLFYGLGEGTCICFSVYTPGGGGGGGQSCSPKNELVKRTARGTLVWSLSKLPYGPNEELHAVDCPSPRTVSRKWRTQPYDVCVKTEKERFDNTIYLGHTHPLFTKEDEGKTIICNGVSDVLEEEDIDFYNNLNENCTPADTATAKKYPLLLRTPSGIFKDC